MVIHINKKMIGVAAGAVHRVLLMRLRVLKYTSFLAISGLLAAPVAALDTMAPMSEEELGSISGTGIALALDDFAYMMAPTSYMEQVGITPVGACSGSGFGATNIDCWRRGDLRWYGISITSAVAQGSHWNEVAACDPASATMDCPRGGVIDEFSPFDNPYLMRAWSPLGMAYDGSYINTDSSNPDKTIYEYLAPTNQPDYILSFWGELEVGATRDPETEPLTTGQGINNPNGGALLKSQTIIRGNAAGSIFRMFRHTEPGNETFGMMYTSYLRGDFRFSVNQDSSAASDVIGQPVRFANAEGMHFRNVDAFLPIGQLYYQALVLDAVGTNGDFSLTLTPIPENPTVYGSYYGLMDGDVQGYETARLALQNLGSDCAGDVNCENYRLSHGHVRYGDWHPGFDLVRRNDANDVADGIFFRACPSCSTFKAYAYRNNIIDKRGTHFTRNRVQTYNCPTNTGGDLSNCSEGGVVVSTAKNAVVWDNGCEYQGDSYDCWVTDPDGDCGDLFGDCGDGVPVPVGDPTRTFNTSVVNLGDARMEGLLINRLEIVSCQSGGC